MERSRYPHTHLDNRMNTPPSAQFPSKYGTLPHIPGSPQPSHDNQLMPLKRERGQPQSSGDYSLDTEERVRLLETRVNVTEKSNRALLEEVVRLQSELKQTMRKSDDLLREEHQSRQQVEHSLRSSNDLIAQLSSRVKRTEDKVQEERSAVSALVNHTKSVEQAVIGSQQELINRRDIQSGKIQELKNELDESSRSRDQLERVAYSLVDEIRQLKAKSETQNIDIASVVNELRSKSKRLEDENRQALESVRKQGEIQFQTDHGTTQLRGQVENRLSELRDVLVELRSKQEHETDERRILEQQLQKKVSELQGVVMEQARKREESMHALDSIQREKEHAAETERIKLQGRIAETAEEVSKKILAKEIRLREEAQEKFLQVEKQILNEQGLRMAFERDIRITGDQRWDAVKKLTDDELKGLKDNIRYERSKTLDTLNRLEVAVNLLEQQMEEYKKQNDQIMTAEIKSRKQHESVTLDKVSDVQEKLSIATATLQAAVGGVVAKMTNESVKMKREIKKIANEENEKNTRSLTDLDAKIIGLKSQISQVEDILEAKITAQSAVQSQNVREKIDSISLWQDVTSSTLRELQHHLNQVPQDIQRLEEKLEILKADSNSKVTNEAESRSRDVDSLKRDIARLANVAHRSDSEGPPANKSDFDACQESLHKLQESVQTVKAILGMKIASEQKMRVEEVKNLQDDINRLRSLLGQQHDDKQQPRLFIKPENYKNRKDAEKKQPDINKWSIYSAYRWIDWKYNLTYLKWKVSDPRRKTQNKSDTPKTPNMAQNTPTSATPQKTPSPDRDQGDQSDNESDTNEDPKSPTPDKKPNSSDKEEEKANQPNSPGNKNGADKSDQ